MKGKVLRRCHRLYYTVFGEIIGQHYGCFNGFNQEFGTLDGAPETGGVHDAIHR